MKHPPDALQDHSGPDGPHRWKSRDSGRYSYRQNFKTKKNEWIEVSLLVDKFVATFHGRVFPDQRLDPGKVNSVGFLLADKKAGPFKLEVDWIRVVRTTGEQ